MLYEQTHSSEGFPMQTSIMYGASLFANHCHEELEIIEILEGKLHVTSGDLQWDLEKGDILMLAPFQCHAITSAAPDTVRKVIMIKISVLWTHSTDQDEMQMVQDALNCRDLYSGDWDPEIRQNAAALVDAIYEESMDHRPGWKLAVQSCLGLLLLKAVRDMPKTRQVLSAFRYSDEKLRDILSYIDRNFTGQISLRECADRVGFSAAYLSRYFSSRMGITFQEYIKTLRVEKAQWLLLTRDLSITEISYQSGFRDIRTFNRLFRQQCGFTPREFRKQAGKNNRKGETT